MYSTYDVMVTLHAYMHGLVENYLIAKKKGRASFTSFSVGTHEQCMYV